MVEYREILKKGDMISFNLDLLEPMIKTYYSESLNKEIKHISKCKWIPKENELFIVKSTHVGHRKVDGVMHYELMLSLYSAKGPWTSLEFPASMCQWVHQFEDGKANRSIFISEVFNDDLFEAIGDGDDVEWKWLSYQDYMKDVK